MAVCFKDSQLIFFTWVSSAVSTPRKIYPQSVDSADPPDWNLCQSCLSIPGVCESCAHSGSSSVWRVLFALLFEQLSYSLKACALNRL